MQTSMSWAVFEHVVLHANVSCIGGLQELLKPAEDADRTPLCVCLVLGTNSLHPARRRILCFCSLITSVSIPVLCNIGVVVLHRNDTKGYFPFYAKRKSTPGRILLQKDLFPVLSDVPNSHQNVPRNIYSLQFYRFPWWMFNEVH